MRGHKRETCAKMFPVFIKRMTLLANPFLDETDALGRRLFNCTEGRGEVTPE